MSGHDAWLNEQAGGPEEEAEEPWPDFSSDEHEQAEADPVAAEEDPVAAEEGRISDVLQEVEYVQQLQYLPPRRQSGAL